MFVVTPSTLLNPGALEMQSVPKRLLGRVMVLPRRAISAPVLLRLVVESQPLRYITALLPFVLAMLIWPDLALPIAQAPLFMIIAIWLVEIKLLRHPRDRRDHLISEDDADRTRDLLRHRASGLLQGIAARHGLDQGELTLVVEQSELARIAPLTLVSVQQSGVAPRVLDLGPADHAALATLFDGDLTERALHNTGWRDDVFLRQITIDARSVPAHIRLDALLAAEAQPA
jgi:hypothetical protein